MNEKVCPNCQAINRPGANFCATCGQGLKSASLTENDEAPTVPSGSVSSRPLPASAEPQTPDPSSFELRVGRQTHTGRVRRKNEDSLLVFDYLCANRSIARPAGLFVVADGMGGHEGGEIASGMLVRALARRAVAVWLPAAIAGPEDPLDREGWLESAIAGGNEEIFEWALEAGMAMGTTVVAALVEGDRAIIAHVGDSRAYRVHAAGIERLTTDHSLVESLIAANQISPDEARKHPQANVIYRTIGDSPQVVVDMIQMTLQPGEFLMLCSDGLSGMLADEIMRELVLAAKTPQAACEALIEAANRAGGEDNSTVILVELKSL